jgi:hypothetical protein
MRPSYRPGNYRTHIISDSYRSGNKETQGQSQAKAILDPIIERISSCRATAIIFQIIDVFKIMTLLKIRAGWIRQKRRKILPAAYLDNNLK